MAVSNDTWKEEKFGAQTAETKAAEIVNWEDDLAPSIFKVPEILWIRKLQEDRKCVCDRKCKRNIESRSCNHFCSGKVNKYYTLRVRVCSLKVFCVQCACAIHLYLACPAVLYFSTLSHTMHDFGKRKLPDTTFVFWFLLQLCSKHFSF